MKALTPLMLAETVLDGTAMECRYLIDFAKKMDALHEQVDEGKLYIEIFAFYQFITLATVGAKFDLHGNDLNLFGGDLNQACQEMAKGKWKPLEDLINSAISDPAFHRIVSAYFREEIALSGLNEQEFDHFKTFLVNDEKHRGGIMTAYLLAYTRILRSVSGEAAEATDFMGLLTNSFSMFGWLSHLEATTNFSKALAEQLQDATYKGGNPDDLPIEPFVK